MKIYQSDIHAFVGECIRCRVGSVSARFRKCAGCEGLGFGLVRDHVWTETVCLHITKSRMGYIKICPDGKFSCTQYPMD
jgi:hypothetical protein